MRAVNAAKGLYHRLVPSSVRNPIGLFRRNLIDRAQRLIVRPKLPPVDLLANIQLTPFANEYLRIGRRSARNIVDTLTLYGSSPSEPLTFLDFGCGSARLLRHLDKTRWTLHGCDIDRAAVDWAARNIPFATFRPNDSEPPLPYSDGSLDIVTAISLFTHFTPAQQRAWINELHRVMKPKGLLLMSTMGPSVIANFPVYATAANIEKLRDSGAIYVAAGESFNANAAFHSTRGVIALTADKFELLSWSEQGLDGFQDLSVLRRK
jgi:SAM-dependent methyltransferase